MFSLIAALVVQFRNAFADRRDVLLENAALRQQLAIYQRTGKRAPLTSADRLFWVWLSRIWPRWRSAHFIVQPETVIRGHRDVPEDAPLGVFPVQEASKRRLLARSLRRTGWGDRSHSADANASSTSAGWPAGHIAGSWPAGIRNPFMQPEQNHLVSPSGTPR
jgi:hypothetical protein